MQRRSRISAIVVAGVSGVGKTTVGRALADVLDWDFEDADELHSAHNLYKMSAGEPLRDEDRWPWLVRVRSVLDASVTEDGRHRPPPMSLTPTHKTRQQRSHHFASGALVMACSALRRCYVDFLIGKRPQIRLAYLRVDEEILASRIASRRDHFFPPQLLASQLEIQEFPRADQVFDGSLPAPAVAREIARRFGLAD